MHFFVFVSFGVDSFEISSYAYGYMLGRGVIEKILI